MILAKGDLQRAAACGGEGWRQLAEGDALGALRVARRDRTRSAAMRLLEAEALMAAGAIVGGLDRLDALHREGDATATLALARRRHLLGDHVGAERAAAALPINAHAALIGARAALANNRIMAAFRFVEPFLAGAAPLPEPAVAGAVAVLAASLMARTEQYDRLQHFASRMLGTPDLPDDMMPMAARVAWTAGLAAQAWDRFGTSDNPWMVVARLELAMLAGDLSRASLFLKRAGPLGAPSAAGLFLLSGNSESNGVDAETERMFGEGVTVHIWRTHPHRWQPWIDAALQTPADVTIFDLAKHELPDVETIPPVVLDDGALIELLPPVPVRIRLGDGSGLWIGQPLCRGIGIGHDWPDEETRVIRESAPLASSRESAAVWVLGADAALAHTHEGRPMVVVAPPGDPFWGGPFPERAWPAMRVVRVNPRTGWGGTGARVVDAANTFSTVSTVT
jgi:hypothetical protein